MGNTDTPGTALGQTPLRAGSVFNFYRPGYVAPGTQSATRNLAAPELQAVPWRARPPTPRRRLREGPPRTCWCQDRPADRVGRR